MWARRGSDPAGRDVQAIEASTWPGFLLSQRNTNADGLGLGAPGVAPRTVEI
jgi:hypothetical protein